MEERRSLFNSQLTYRIEFRPQVVNSTFCNWPLESLQKQSGQVEKNYLHQEITLSCTKHSKIWIRVLNLANCILYFDVHGSNCTTFSRAGTQFPRLDLNKRWFLPRPKTTTA